MHAVLRAGVRTLLAAILSAWGLCATAQTFQLISQERALDVYWLQGLFPGIGQPQINDVPAHEGFFATGPWDAALGHAGFNTITLEDGSATASSQASVDTRSFIGTERLSFDTRASAGAFGHATLPASYIAGSSGNSRMQVAFDIAAPVTVNLAWSTDLGSTGSRFDVNFTRNFQTVFFLQGEAATLGLGAHSFQEVLLLQPGRYEFFANVMASAYSSDRPYPDNLPPGSSTTFASFVLAPVPEPETWLLMIAGLCAVAVVRRVGIGRA